MIPYLLIPINKLKQYIRNVLVSLDQLLNSMFGGSPDETISSRLGKHYRNSWLYLFLNWIEPNHCDNVIESDEGEDAVIKRFNFIIL